MTIKLQPSAVALSLALSSAPLYATSLTPLSFNIEGFATVGMSTIDSDKVTVQNADDQIRFDIDSVTALQLRFPFNEQFQFITQIVAEGRTNFEPEFEWAYLNIQARSETDVHAGRMRIPFYALSDTLEIGYTYPWVRPPMEVYRQVPFDRFDGLSLLKHASMTDWNWLGQAYFGNTSPSLSYFGDRGTMDITNLWGINLSAETGNWKFRLGHTEGDFTMYNYPALEQFLAQLESAGFTELRDRFSITDRHGSFSGVGLSYENDSWLVISEYTWLRTNGLIPDTESGYFTVGFQTGNLLPHLTLAQTSTKEDYDTAEPILGPDMIAQLKTDQTSATLGIRYYINTKTVFKLELEHIMVDDDSNGLTGIKTGPDKHINMLSTVVDIVF